MLKHSAKLTSAVLIAGFLFAGCAAGTGNDTTTTAGETTTTASETTTTASETTATSEPAATAGEIELTLEELSQYDGKDGNPAYVAVDGVIYDVTDSAAWKEGGHNGFEAGKDLTEEIKNVSPHGVSMLERVPAIGRIVE